MEPKPPTTADWSKPLGGFTVSRMSRTGGRDVAVAMRDCGISTTSRTRPVCKHCFSALPIDKTSSVEAQIGLLWRSFAHLATGCGINAKDPSGLDSDRWIPHSRCCENPARAKALAGFSRHLSAGFTDLNLGVFRYRISILCQFARARTRDMTS